MILFKRWLSGYALSGLVCIVSFLIVAPTVNATKFWKNSVTTGNWNTGNNWSAVSAAGADNVGVPIAFEPVRIVHTDGTARSVTLNTSTPLLGLMSIDLTGTGTASDSLLVSTNNSLTAGGLTVGGHNGVAETNGRGTITQSNGTITTSAGLDLVVGNGVGSTGNYNLSGTGAVVANQSLYIGYKGNGTFTQTGGTTTLNASGVGTLDIGILSSATGTYNLSGGSLTANTSEYVGDQGVGVFNHSGGTNTIVGAGRGLTLGYAASGNGTYTASGNASLTVPGDVTVGLSGTGTLNIQGQSSVHIANNLAINGSSNVNLNGGTLRLNTLTGLARLNYFSGTLKLGGNRALGFDPIIGHFFGTSPTIPSGKRLDVEGDTTLFAGNATVSGGRLSSYGMLRVGYNDGAGATLNITNGATLVTFATTRIGEADGTSTVVPGVVNVSGSGSNWQSGELEIGRNGRGALNITGGGTVFGTNVVMGFGNVGADSSYDTLVVSGPGSSLTSGNDLYVGYNDEASLTINNGANVFVNDQLYLGADARVTIDGGTLRFNTFDRFDNGFPEDRGEFIYTTGTIQLGGNRNIGSEAVLQELYGAAPVLPVGKGLTIESVATLSKPLTISGGTFKANSVVIASGGALDFDRGVLEVSGGTITGLARLNVPTNGEFRASGGFQGIPISGAAGSTITAIGNIIMGSATAVNGFGTQGILSVGANTVTLLDSNDAVFDSTALATLGTGASPGTLSAANGLTLDFGGNITGHGTISTPNNIAKPLINNGHLIGTSAAQRITLPGYVKGVGTLDNVNVTGTLSPGLSPTTSMVGNLGFSPTSTLIMEIGGTAAGSQYDQIISSGQLGFDGILQVELINGFTPSAGQSFNLFDWQSVSGTFDTLNLPTLAGSLAWNTSQLYTTGTLSIAAAAGLPGEFNSDGAVNAADYVAWRKGVGVASTPANYNLWRTNFGRTASGSGAAVPEPANFVLVLFASAGAALILDTRRRTT